MVAIQRLPSQQGHSDILNPGKFEDVPGFYRSAASAPAQAANHAVPCPYSTMTCPYIQG